MSEYIIDVPETRGDVDVVDKESGEIVARVHAGLAGRHPSLTFDPGFVLSPDSHITILFPKNIRRDAFLGQSKIDKIQF